VAKYPLWFSLLFKQKSSMDFQCKHAWGRLVGVFFNCQLRGKVGHTTGSIIHPSRPLSTSFPPPPPPIHTHTPPSPTHPFQSLLAGAFTLPLLLSDDLDLTHSRIATLSHLPLSKTLCCTGFALGEQVPIALGPAAPAEGWFGHPRAGHLATQDFPSSL
jgi:hypothetical protein